MPNQNNELYESLLSRSKVLKGGMGAIAFATLEMFRRGGLSEKEVDDLYERMQHHFMKPTNEECNAILNVVESRLNSDKEPGSETWYH